MHRIDGANPGPGNTFVEGDPISGAPATQVTGAWATAVQEELAAVVEGAGLVLSKPNNGQVLEAIDLLARPNQLYRNALINSDFSVWQRYDGNIPLTTGQVAFFADHWRFSPGGGGGAASNVGGFNQTAAQTALTGTRNGFTLVQTVGGSVPYFEQRIENVVALSGLPMVFSIWMDCYTLGSGTSITIGTEVIQNFGPAGSADVVTAGPSIVVPLGASGSPARYSATLTVPSVVGKSFGNNTAHFTAIRLKFPTSLTFGCNIYCAQFERGLTASNQLELPFAVELALCQRYYVRSYVTMPFATGSEYPGALNYKGSTKVIGVGTNGYGLDVRLPVPMRATPTVTWYSPDENLTPARVFWEGATRTVTGTVGTTAQHLGYPTVGSARAISDLMAHWVAEIEL